MSTIPSKNETNNTTGAGEQTSPTKSGQLGDKIKGAMHVVHGIGENVRGTTLGAIDSLGKQGGARHEEIARKGRLESEHGYAAWKGQPAASGGEVGEGHPDNGVQVQHTTDAVEGVHVQPYTEEKSAQSYPTPSSRDQGGPGQVGGVEGSQEGSGFYHRDDAATDPNVRPGEQKPVAGQLSLSDQERLAEYDRKAGLDPNQGRT